MNTRYLLIAALAVVAGLMLWLLPMRVNVAEIPPDQLLDEIKDQTRYYTTDQVAKMIIDSDPLLLLADVRPGSEFARFSLPGSINIPIDSLLQPDFLDVLADGTRSIVFISADGMLAEQAWMLCKRMKMNHIHIMKGGLDQWVETILEPRQPSPSDAGSEHDRYLSRLGARQFFTGAGNPALSPREPATQQQSLPLTPRKKQTKLEGGC